MALREPSLPRFTRVLPPHTESEPAPWLAWPTAHDGSGLPGLQARGRPAMRTLSHFSGVRLSAAPRTARQAALSMGLSRQGCWRGCQALLPGAFLTPGPNLRLSGFLHWLLGSFPLAPPGEPSGASAFSQNPTAIS